MNREKNLAKNTFIITIGKICTQLITFLLLPVYTSLLSTEEYGIVDLLNTIVALGIPIVTFQIEEGVFRHLIDCRKEKKEISNTITTVLVTLGLQSLMYVFIFLIIAPLIKNDYKYFLLTNVIANIYANIMMQIARGLGNNKKYAFASFLTALTTVLLNILFIVVLKWGAYGMLGATLSGNIICFIYIFLSEKIYRYINLKYYSKTLLKKLWKYSIPLIPNAISWWIFNSSDRIIVSSVLGLGENGILSAAYKFSNVFITLYNIFNITWTESAALHIDDSDNNEYFSKIINLALKFYSAVCFGIIAIMPFVFPIMVNEKFGDAYNQIPILMIASLFNVLVGLLSAIYVARKDTKAVARTSIYAAIINLIVNLAFIKYIGLYAASVSTLVAYFMMSIYRIIDVRKYIKIKIDKKFILSLFIMMIFIIMSYYIGNSYLCIICFILTFIFAVIINRDLIISLFRVVKNKHKGGI